MNLKVIAAVGLLAVGVGAVGVTLIGLGGSGVSPVTYRTAQVTTTNVEQTAAASGSLAAATVYDLAFGETPVAIDGTSTSGGTSSTASAAGGSTSTGGTGSVTVTWPVTAVNVAVGDLVTAGDVLATADTASAELAVRQAEADLAAAKRQKKLDQKGGTASARASARAQVTSARTQLSNAQSSYSSTVAQNNLKLKQARQAVSAAETQLKKDKKAGAPAATIAQDKAAVTAAKQNYESTRLQTAASNRSAANQVTSARQSVTNAQRTYRDATSAADNATLIADDVAIAQAQQALADARAALDAGTITAPIDGRVTAVNVAVGDDASGTAIELQSTRLAVSLSVTEDDILSLAVGQAATVAISATGATATGTVTSIDPVATSSGSSSVVSYTVVVTLDAATGGAATASGGDAQTAATAAPSAAPAKEPLPGMSAEVTIVIAQADNAIAVPAIALSGTAGNYTVRVMNSDGSVETRSVGVGLIASDYAQITSGLSDGETVVTGSSADRTTTTTTTTTTNGRDRFGGGFGGLDGGGGFQPPAGGFPGGAGGN